MSMVVTDNYFPFDTGPGASATLQRWREMGRLFCPSGVIPGYLNQMTCSQAGSVVTVGLGGAFIDGFYGEISQTAKTISVSGNGMVVARMDPVAKQVYVTFVANQTAPAQPTNATGNYEIPLWQVTGATGHDIRQFAYPIPTTTHAVVGQRIYTYYPGPGWATNATTWQGAWSSTYTKIRPDTYLDFFFTGSSYAAVAGGAVEWGVQITAPNASGVANIAHYFHNTASDHRTYAGAAVGLGQELINAKATGNVTWELFVTNSSAAAPQMRSDANDFFSLTVTERMP